MKNVIVVLTFLISCSAFSQTYVVQVKPIGSPKWGYANIKGEIIIPAQFVHCNKFSPEGFAPIYNYDQDNPLYYFINLKGEILKTEIRGFELLARLGYDMEGFTNGLAPVKFHGKWGYIGSDGKYAIRAKYDKAFEFNEGYAIVNIGEQFFVINTNGQDQLVEGPGISLVRNFSEGLAPFRGNKGRFGFIGTDGKQVIPAQFDNVGYFHHGLAWARTTDDKVGFIDQKGEWAVKPRFDAARSFDAESGLARVSKSGQWMYVNTSGITFKSIETELYGDFSEGLALGRSDRFVGFYNNKMEWIITPQFDGARDFKNGFAAARYLGKWGVIDKKGNWVITPAFGAIKDMELVDSQ